MSELATVTSKAKSCSRSHKDELERSSRARGRVLHVASGRSCGDDPLIDALAKDGTAYVPFFPLGGFSPLQSSVLSNVAGTLGATPVQVALAWPLQRSPNILLIPGMSSVAHLRENLKAADLALDADSIRGLDAISSQPIAA